MKYCPKCGTAIKSDLDSFCPECGTKLGSSLQRTGQQKLYRSRYDRVIAGVCSGLGKHLNVDPTIIRIAFIIAAFVYGIGIIAYILFWVLTPEEPV